MFCFNFVLFCFTKGSQVHPHPVSQTTQPDIVPSPKVAPTKVEPNDVRDADDDDEAQEPLIADALIGKQEKDRSNTVDVKIGDGMDIAIHGENGKPIAGVKTINLILLSSIHRKIVPHIDA